MMDSAIGDENDTEVTTLDRHINSYRIAYG